jgi:hypothetical protein
VPIALVAALLVAALLVAVVTGAVIGVGLALFGLWM